MLDKYMVSYNHEESILHILNPVIKFISFLLFIISCFFKFSILLFILDMVWVFVLLLLSNISLKEYFMIIWKYKYLLIFIYILLYSMNYKLIYINIIIFKIIACILYYYLILFTTTKREFTKGLGIIFGFNNIKKVSSFFNKIYLFFYNFVVLNNEKIELYSIKGEDRIFIGVIKKIYYSYKYLKVNIKDSIDKVRNDNENMRYLLYNDNCISKYKYRNKLNIFDYLLLLFFIFIYVFYVIRVR